MKKKVLFFICIFSLLLSCVCSIVEERDVDCFFIVKHENGIQKWWCSDKKGFVCEQFRSDDDIWLGTCVQFQIQGGIH